MLIKKKEDKIELQLISTYFENLFDSSIKMYLI